MNTQNRMSDASEKHAVAKIPNLFAKYNGMPIPRNNIADNGNLISGFITRLL